ncbi:MAG: hypothetical protein QOJ29_4126 [Thermoleophilaceae bacterium]|nr:hypothetical protein [Thermoleophilaceae bacterium]
MPRLMRATPWGRILWMLQIVFSSFQELDATERKQAREIAQRAYRNRRLDAKDREKLVGLAKKAGRGAARGVRGGGMSGLRGRKR